MNTELWIVYETLMLVLTIGMVKYAKDPMWKFLGLFPMGLWLGCLIRDIIKLIK